MIDPTLLREYLTIADTLVLVVVGTAIIIYHKYVIVPRVRVVRDLVDKIPSDLVTKKSLEEHCITSQHNCSDAIKELILENRRLSKEQKEELERIIGVTVKAEILMAIDGKLNRRDK